MGLSAPCSVQNGEGGELIFFFSPFAQTLFGLGAGCRPLGKPDAQNAYAALSFPIFPGEKPVYYPTAHIFSSPLFEKWTMLRSRCPDQLLKHGTGYGVSTQKLFTTALGHALGRVQAEVNPGEVGVAARGVSG